MGFLSMKDKSKILPLEKDRNHCQRMGLNGGCVSTFGRRTSLETHSQSWHLRLQANSFHETCPRKANSCLEKNQRFVQQELEPANCCCLEVGFEHLGKEDLKPTSSCHCSAQAQTFQMTRAKTEWFALHQLIQALNRLNHLSQNQGVASDIFGCRGLELDCKVHWWYYPKTKKYIVTSILKRFQPHSNSCFYVK